MITILDGENESILLAKLFFQDCPHRFASALSVKGTSSSSQVSIPAQESVSIHFLH